MSTYERLREWLSRLLGLPQADITPGTLLADLFRRRRPSAAPAADDPLGQDLAAFAQQLGADSLDQVEFIMAVEEEFDFEMSDEEAERWRQLFGTATVQDLVEYVESRKDR